MFVKCGKCGINYQPNHGCGMAVICGKPFVIHCNEPTAHIKEAAFKGIFKPWEAPADCCPMCWHSAYPKKFGGHGV